MQRQRDHSEKKAKQNPVYVDDLFQDPIQSQNQVLSKRQFVKIREPGDDLLFITDPVSGSNPQYDQTNPNDKRKK